jgi:hypothetical protein
LQTLAAFALPSPALALCSFCEFDLFLSFH